MAVVVYDRLFVQIWCPPIPDVSIDKKVAGCTKG
jgi:hypothetical protein